MRASSRRFAWLAVGAAAAQAACGPAESRPVEMRLPSTSFQFTVSSQPQPPYAREGTVFKLVVHDRKSREPIELGRGRIYSSNRDEAKTWDELHKGAEVGVYYGRLNFVTSGEWAIAVEFRRDSTARMEKVEWMQEVLAAREAGGSTRAVPGAAR
jgi:hypothetical protein